LTTITPIGKFDHGGSTRFPPCIQGQGKNQTAPLNHSTTVKDATGSVLLHATEKEPTFMFVLKIPNLEEANLGKKVHKAFIDDL
jgi:hypothetical protein